MGVIKDGYRSLNVEVDLFIILVLVSWLTVVLRLWVRWRLINSLGGDDLFIVIALVRIHPVPSTKRSIANLTGIQIFFSAFIGMVMVINFLVPTGNPTSFQVADLAFKVCSWKS